MIINDSPIMVFDVESIGLHGEGFAVGYVVIDPKEGQKEYGIFACYPVLAQGTDADRKWVSENVAIHPADYNMDSTERVRNAFWTTWKRWKGKGASLAAEVCWPVEANFLSACIADDPEQRRNDGPYPFYDIASIRAAAHFDPLQTEERISELEIPAHNPLADARQSARLLLATLYELFAMRTSYQDWKESLRV